VQLPAGEGLCSGVDLARPHRSTGQSEHKREGLEHRTRPGRWRASRLFRASRRLLEQCSAELN